MLQPKLRGSRSINRGATGDAAALTKAKRAKIAAEEARRRGETNLPTGTSEKPSSAAPGASPVFALPFNIDPVVAGVGVVLLVIVLVVAFKKK